MHKKDFFPLYCVHISRFHSAVTSNPKSFSPAATLDPLPRHWTRDRDFGPATRDPRLLVKLIHVCHNTVIRILLIYKYCGKTHCSSQHCWELLNSFALSNNSQHFLAYNVGNWTGANSNTPNEPKRQDAQTQAVRCIHTCLVLKLAKYRASKELTLV